VVTLELTLTDLKNNNFTHAILFIYFIHSLRHRGSTHYTTNMQNKTQSKNTKH